MLSFKKKNMGVTAFGFNGIRKRGGAMVRHCCRHLPLINRLIPPDAPVCVDVEAGDPCEGLRS